jgi:D-threonate/D-erythronate kinase
MAHTGSPMIGVIADDLTGAAEIGAVGLRHGLRGEVVLSGEPSGKAELACLDTDSRSCAPSEAAERAAHGARILRHRRADWLYKKTDSVLRGNVTPELEAIVRELCLDGALLVPANPALGRTIVGGQYFVRGRLIHETEFAREPTHPRLSPNVRELVAAPATLPFFVRRANEGLPERGIVIGEVSTSDDLRHWAALRKGRWLMAGGAEFFGALLKLPVSSSQSEYQPGKELFVCGSASEATRNFVSSQAQEGVPVFSLPQEVVSGFELGVTALNWVVDQVVAALQSAQRVVLRVWVPPVREVSLAEMLALELVRVAEAVLRRGQVRHVFAEGGATAVALARQMGWHRLQVLSELALGVVTLSTQDGSSLLFTVKPGTYLWPENLAALRSP